MNTEEKYDEEFYNDRDRRTRYSAERIVSIVMDHVNPRSVADVGCGVGTWLKTFKNHGVETVLGIEGPWLNQDNLVIEKEEFQHWDLTQPLEKEKKFDLAMSLEVAEHLEEKYARLFVETLTGLAPVVLFSAAVPLQGGVKHLNEQWPSYWKALFEEKDYCWIDAIRPVVWDDPKVEVWYAQNSFLYVHKDVLGDYPALKALEGFNTHMIDAVSRRFFVNKMRSISLTKWFKNKLGRLI